MTINSPDCRTASRTAARRLRDGTPQQEAFWAELTDGTSHVLLQARAGTGKSTSCAEAMHRLDTGLDLVYCAFNKSIAQEFEAKAPANCRSATMHSLGFAAIKAAHGPTAVREFKTMDLAERFFPRKWEDREARGVVAKLVSHCKANLLDGKDADGLKDAAGAAGLDLGSDAEIVLEAVPAILEESRRLISVIDYDDMIWLPIVLDLNFPRCDMVFIDEAQDLNALQHRFVGQICPDGRVVAVGDDRQAIYAFRGADADSLATLGATLQRSARGLARLPLTVTWRCPSSHVRLANRIVADLAAAPGAARGVVNVTSPDWPLGGIPAGSMALCRTNGPLVSGCYQLLREGRRAVVRGRDIGKGMLSLLAKLGATTIPDLAGLLDEYQARERDKLSRLKHPAPALMALEDKCSCLLALTDGQSSIDGLKARIGSLFEDAGAPDAVVFSSVHRSKGLEADDVLVLRPDLMPHPMAKTPADAGQEANLAYVAATRSKHSLTFVGPIPSLLN